MLNTTHSNTNKETFIHSNLDNLVRKFSLELWSVIEGHVDLALAYVAGVERGREKGNLGARERVGRAFLPRAPKFPLPLSTPATQASLALMQHFLFFILNLCSLTSICPARFSYEK